MTDRPERVQDERPDDADADTDAPPGASASDLGRETQPRDRAAVAHSADAADRLERRSRPSDDTAGITPTRREAPPA